MSEFLIEKRAWSLDDSYKSNHISLVSIFFDGHQLTYMI
jgi:hypothetical protein